MGWLNDLFFQESVARTILIYSVIIFIGVFLGKIKIFGISLGITFVLFTGIAMAHFGFTANHQVVYFIRDFGLMLFVFFVGLQVGPGFFASFRKGGLAMNMMALAIVVLGALTTIILHFITGTSIPVLTGIMTGAVTNTPGLGAAQNALAQTAGMDPGQLPDIGLGYAVAYPFGVLGVILTMFAIRKTFRINVSEESELYDQEQHPSEKVPEKVSILVTNPRIFYKTIPQVTNLIPEEFIISRVLHNGVLHLASSETVIHENDIILVVTQKRFVPEIVRQTGAVSDVDLTATAGPLSVRRIIVTHRGIFGKQLGSLMLRTRFNVNITRLYRSGIELVASPNLRMQMGDKLTVVGDEQSLEKVTKIMGDSVKQLNEPNLVPIFIGIFLGVILGAIPIFVPGVINPIRLGLAGGPLIVAILLSKYGYRFSLISYTTPSANLMLREIGIVLFLASAGILSGEKFVDTLVAGDGFLWMGYGAIITLIPIITGGVFARYVLKKNYLEICGLLSGSMTDPPALAYANGIAPSDAPSVVYASVYPLVMFLRIFIAQMLILLFA